VALIANCNVVYQRSILKAYFQEEVQKQLLRRLMSWLHSLTHYTNSDGKIEVGDRGAGHIGVLLGTSKCHGPKGNVAI
jgi:hypothetical protein